MDNTVGSRTFIQEQGEVDGNSSIMRDLPGRWEEPSFTANTSVGKNTSRNGGQGRGGAQGIGAC